MREILESGNGGHHLMEGHLSVRGGDIRQVLLAETVPAFLACVLVLIRIGRHQARPNKAMCKDQQCTRCHVPVKQTMGAEQLQSGTCQAD